MSEPRIWRGLTISALIYAAIAGGCASSSSTETQQVHAQLAELQERLSQLEHRLELMDSGETTRLVRIHVVDATTGQPLPGQHVCVDAAEQSSPQPVNVTFGVDEEPDIRLIPLYPLTKDRVYWYHGPAWSTPVGTSWQAQISGVTDEAGVYTTRLALGAHRIEVAGASVSPSDPVRRLLKRLTGGETAGPSCTLYIAHPGEPIDVTLKITSRASGDAGPDGKPDGATDAEGQ